jgi:hypothetical protein
MSKSATTMTNAKALNTVLGDPVTTKVNSAANTVATIAANVSENMRNSAANSVSSITNSIKSLNTTIATPLKESIASVPDSAPALGIMLPIILCIGALVIALTLVYYYRTSIENNAYGAYSYVKGLFTGSDGKETTQASYVPPPPLPPPLEQSPLEYPPQQQGLPDPKTDVINKLLPGSKQVFNVSANKYTYNDAEPLCKALGAQLATYDQVKQAWDEGADWCNYGWIKGQAAVYPTQQTTFDELQGGSTDDERLACGEPGVNGGFYDNPELRFGVNCYGEKPAQSSNDLRITNENAYPPLTPDALNQKKKALAYAAERDTIGVLPFKAHTWSQ